MAKDFIGLNICVRDIFQGVDDCGHSYEKHGFSELNTLGFTSSTITGLGRLEITIAGLDKIQDQDYFAITASGVTTTHVLKFGFSTGSIATDLKIDLSGLGVIPISSEVSASILTERINAAIIGVFNFKQQDLTQFLITLRPL